jgi:hypothetical protein
VIMKARPQRLRRPRWSMDSPAPLRRLPGVRREVNAPGPPPGELRADDGRWAGGRWAG